MFVGAVAQAWLVLALVPPLPPAAAMCIDTDLALRGDCLCSPLDELSS